MTLVALGEMTEIVPLVAVAGAVLTLLELAIVRKVEMGEVV